MEKNKIGPLLTLGAVAAVGGGIWLANVSQETETPSPVAQSTSATVAAPAPPPRTEFWRCRTRTRRVAWPADPTDRPSREHWRSARSLGTSPPPRWSRPAVTATKVNGDDDVEW